jgi:cobalamin biosynthesis Mg chelatase CobN
MSNAPNEFEAGAGVAILLIVGLLAIVGVVALIYFLAR